MQIKIYPISYLLHTHIFVYKHTYKQVYANTYKIYLSLTLGHFLCFISKNLFSTKKVWKKGISTFIFRFQNNETDENYYHIMHQHLVKNYANTKIIRYPSSIIVISKSLFSVFYNSFIIWNNENVKIFDLHLNIFLHFGVPVCFVYRLFYAIMLMQSPSSINIEVLKSNNYL